MATRIPYLISDHEVVIGVSIGIAIGDGTLSPVEVLFSYADTALYAAKEAGRGTFRFYQSNLAADVNVPHGSVIAHSHP
jgi:predicted signal transduction protein with EAL and GGDEF domain